MEAYRFRLEFDVRDYECDLQGIVNNAVYQNYLEHTRHIFLRESGVDFAALSRDGVDLVVVRVELDYLSPLRSGDRFWVGLELERISTLRFGFRQGIYALPDDRPILRGRVIGTALNQRGRPFLPERITRLWPEEAE